MSLSLRSRGLMAVALWWPLLAQAPENSVISMDVKRVILYATVREGKAHFVGDLQKDDFEVFENGVRQEIISFSREDLPVATGILVDNSRSMMNKQSEVVAAAKSFVRASNTKDEIFVLHFNEKLTYGLPTNTPFTSDHALLAEALDRMQLDGRTALYDGILEALNHLKKSDLTKKALFVISDGGDNVSRHKDEDVIREADLSGALFYAIGIYDEMDGDAKPAVLRSLAQNTGGEAYFPKKVAEVRTLCETIARDLRSQYMISYAPRETSNAGDGYRKIRVRVKDPKGRKLIVRTRTGYHARSTVPAEP